MTDPLVHTLRDDLARLRAAHERETAALRAELRALRPAPAPRIIRRGPRRAFPLILAALFVALVPFATLAAGPTFADLGDAATVHQPNIQAIGDAGITTGFENPANPNTRLYNPKGQVTREEMASFLARTAGLGTNPPVANAARLGGKGANELVRANGARVLSVTVGGTYADAGTASIEVPAPGYVLAVGSATINISQSGQNCPCVVLARLEEVGAPNYSYNFNLRSEAGENDSAAVTHLFTAQPGTHTYRLGLQKQTVGSTVGGTGELTLLYIPFGPTGTAP